MMASRRLVLPWPFIAPMRTTFFFFVGRGRSNVTSLPYDFQSRSRIRFRYTSGPLLLVGRRGQDLLERIVDPVLRLLAGLLQLGGDQPFQHLHRHPDLAA